MFDEFSRRSRRSARLSAVGLAGFVAIVLLASPRARADVYWSTSEGDWSNPAYWGGTLPTSAVNAWIINGGTANVTQAGETCDNLFLGNGGGSGTVQMTGGNLSSIYQYVGDSGTGTFIQSGGTNSSPNLNLAYYAGNRGTYNLSGNGLVSAGYENVGLTGTGTFAQSGGGNSVTDNLNLGYWPGSSGTFSQSGGITSVGGNLILGNSGGGTYNLSGNGQLSAAYDDVGWSGVGTFTQSGGTNGSRNLNLGYNSSGSGTYNLSGNGQVSPNYENVGLSGVGAFTQSGGGNSVTYNLNLGYWPGSSGTFSQSGGTTSVGGNLNLGVVAGSGGTCSLSGSGLISAAYEVVGWSGAGIFMQSGGRNITGTLCLGYSSGSSGTYSLNGGLLQLSALTAGVGTTIFDFNGGTLQAGSGFSTSLPMTLGTSGGGATFDTAGYAVTLSGSPSGPGNLTLNDSLGTGTLILTASNTYTGGTTVSSGTLQLGDAVANNGYVQGNILNNAAVTFANPAPQTYSGVISGSGGLTKIGSGVLALTSSNTYTGATTISQGKLTVDGWLTNSAVSVTSGTLGGTGFLSSVTVNPSATLAPGDSLGTLSLSGSLILESGTAMNFGLDTPTTSSMIETGTLALNGQQFTDFIFAPTGNFVPGNYDLIQFGSISGSLGTSTTGTIDGIPATLSIQGNDLVLSVPEPSTLALLGVGVLGLVGWAWRRRLREAQNRLAR